MSLIIQNGVIKEFLEFWVKRPGWITPKEAPLLPAADHRCSFSTLLQARQSLQPLAQLPFAVCLPAERRNLSWRLSLLSNASLRWRPPRSSRLVASWPSWWPASTSSSAHSLSFPTHSGWSAAEVLEVTTVRFASQQSIQSRKVYWQTWDLSGLVGPAVL